MRRGGVAAEADEVAAGANDRAAGSIPRRDGLLVMSSPPWTRAHCQH